MRKLWKDEKGSVLLLTAVAMVVIFGFAALAIDGGNLYHQHMKLQDIADACALAGAQELAKGSEEDEATKVAKKYADNNGIIFEKIADLNNSDRKANIKLGDDTGTIKISLIDDNKVKVELNVNTKNFFAGVLGFTSSDVAVASVAKYGVAQQQIEGVFPLAFIPDDKVEYKTGKEIELLFKEADKGNYGYLDFNHKKPYLSDQKFEETLEEGLDGPLSIGQDIYTQTGNEIKKLVEAFAAKGRLLAPKSYKVKNQHPVCKCTYNDYDEDCPRVITIVMVDKDVKFNGKTEVQIKGFVKIFVEGLESGDKPSDKDTLNVKYLETVDLGSPLGEGDDDGMIKAVRLVE